MVVDSALRRRMTTAGLSTMVMIFFIISAALASSITYTVTVAKDIGIGSGGYGCGQSVVVDSSNNQYITGYFNTSIQFNSTTSLSTSGSHDIFVAKLGTTGNVKVGKIKRCIRSSQR